MDGGCKGSNLPPACQPGSFHSHRMHTQVLSALGHQLLEGRTGQTRGVGRVEGRELVGWVGGQSWVISSVGLSCSLLGAGWAVAPSLLVIHRAGMADQASAEPRSRGGMSGELGDAYGGGKHVSHLPSEQPWVCLRRPPLS